jgi:hypothetical protein
MLADQQLVGVVIIPPLASQFDRLMSLPLTAVSNAPQCVSVIERGLWCLDGSSPNGTSHYDFNLHATSDKHCVPVAFCYFYGMDVFSIVITSTFFYLSCDRSVPVTFRHQDATSQDFTSILIRCGQTVMSSITS